MTNAAAHDTSYDTALAIIGMSGQFPGARNVDAFWQNVAAGVRSIRTFSDDELRAAGVDPAHLDLPNYVKAGAIIEDIDRFDASFFKFAPREAEVMDPQHRLFLEHAYAALEDAAYDAETYRGLVGVFAGSAFSTYLLNNLNTNPEFMEEVGQLQTSIGNDRDSIASTVSYKLNLKGPSFAVQTFCSTSLVAVHLSCQSLLNYECDIALAGGVAISVPQISGYFYEEGGIVSPDGECRTFDTQAQGSVMGNGIGVVVLKRFQEALQDGDQIYAVVRGSAVNNDGSVKVSYTAPGLDGQTEVMVQAISNAGIDVESIQYIEAHGTATMLGDAVELAAMKKAFEASTEKQGFCAIGSVKPNVGHLDRASGVTGLIKTVQALRHQQLPPSLNFERTSSDIDLEDSPFYVNTELREWERNGPPRRAGVNSFGLGGTNAHVVLEEAPLPAPPGPARAAQLLLLSAKSEAALKTAADNLITHLEQHPDLDLADVAYTLQVGRSAFSHRQAVVCGSRGGLHTHEDALQALRTAQAERGAGTYQMHRDRTVAFLFPGLGEQYVGMVQELYKEEPTFRQTVDYCCKVLKDEQDVDLYDVLFSHHGLNGTYHLNRQSDQKTLAVPTLLAPTPNIAQHTSPESEYNKQTALAQPALFVVEYALAQLLLQWGIRPQAMIGYGLGEYVAACIAGVFSLEDALLLVAQRALLISELPRGIMLTVMLSEEDVRPYLDKEVSLAAINTPEICILSGTDEAIEQLEARLAKRGVAFHRMETTSALHLRMMKPLQEAVANLLHTITLKPPAIPYLSNVTGTWITNAQATDPSYWVQHMFQAVRFADGIEHLLRESEHLLLEVGPGQSLGSLVKQHPACDPERTTQVLSTLPQTHERQPDHTFLLNTLGKLWLQGVTVDWQGFSKHEQRHRLSLPTYPFEHQRYWIESPRVDVQSKASERVRRDEEVGREAGRDAGRDVGRDVGRKAEIADWFYQARWEVSALRSQKIYSASPWLIFEDSTGLAQQVAEQLVQQGQQVVRVQRGEQFARLDEHTFCIRPAHSADYEEVCKALDALGQLPRTVLHCWSVARHDEMVTGPDAFRAQQEQGFYSLISLTQALAVLGHDEPVQIVAISTGMQNVTGQEPLQPEKATILGACKVISQENSSIVCRSIDLTFPTSGTWNETTDAASIIAECTRYATSTSDLVVTYRDGMRRVQTYQPVRLEKLDAAGPLPYRHGGTYLITGGLGGIGLELATYLAETFQAKLVLVGRTALPAKGSWAQWLENHDVDERTSRKIRQMQALEALGAEVLVFQADVADETQMRQVIEQTHAAFGSLHGVFHAAGVTTVNAFKPVQDITRTECEMHFSPKVYGTYVLEQVLQGQQLDFCLLFSSVSAVLGGLGFSAYAAANIFLDAFIHKYNRNATQRWVSVNWDTWHVKQDAHGALGATVAVFEMSPAEGLEALTRVLGHQEITHLINSTGDLKRRIQQWIQLESLQDEPDDGQTARTIATTHVSGDYEQTITAIWKRVLGVEQVGLYDNFFDLGGNSLVALQVIAKLKKAFRIHIPAVALFEAPTVSALVAYLQPGQESQPVVQRQALSARRSRARQSVEQEAVAIIGMAGRFPGASNVEQFWQNLYNSVESITFFTPEELEAAGVDPKLSRQPNFVGARPVLDQVDQFDAAFFSYSPREAEVTDPQHRLFIECAWEALEHAGCDPSTYEGLIGVFAGANLSTYMMMLAMNPDAVGKVDDYQMVIGNDKDSLTTSVSYKFNLRGPSFAVQTFCSTSLVATHLACQSLLNGESDIALAGGVSIRVPAVAGHLYQEGGMESPDGHCRTFDAQAKGSMFGDGVGIVVLKRLSEALKDGDFIHAVIKGSAINNDGSNKVSYTAPSVTGQAEVVSTALMNAGVTADTISYVEAHGTATELGDPIEVTSLTKAYQAHTDETGYCAIGSVKTNIGHLDRAAGVSGLIKTVMALEHGIIPASLHYQAPNPEIDFEHSPFFVNAARSEWKRKGTTPRRAGINSLGLGGTNAHVIVEEAPEQKPSGPSRPWQMLVLSAKSASALETATSNLQAYLRQHSDTPLADIAFTLQRGRKRFEHRRMLICRSHEEAIQAIDRAERTQMFSHSDRRTDRPVAFLFPGLGEQYVGMIQELYQQEQSFRQTIDHCCVLLKEQQGVDLQEVLFSTEEQAATSSANSASSSSRQAKPHNLDLRALLGRNGQNGQAASLATQRLKQTALAQPAVFVVEYALAQLLIRWGILPQVMIGYSLGEYVAACLSGVLSLEDALLLVAQRARLIGEQPQGAMLAVMLSEEVIESYLSDEICLAAINAPNTCVLAGPPAMIAQLEVRLGQEDIVCRRVETTHAFHSTMLDPLREAVTELARRIKLHAPAIPYISNVTGTWITDEQATDPSYWAQHMCQTVHFAQGIGHLLQESEYLLLEVGPGQSLGSFVRQHPAYRLAGHERMQVVLSTLPSMYERQSGQSFLLTTLGKLWLNGLPVDWSGFYADEQRQRLPLPTYPFERQRYWIDAAPRDTRSSAHSRSSADNPQAIMEELKREDLSDWFYLPGWKHAAPSIPTIMDDVLAEKLCWLLFLDDRGIGTAMLQALKQHGHTVIAVRPGASFTKQSSMSYTVSPRSRADYEALLKDMRALGNIPQKVVHLWTVTPEAPEQVAQEELLHSTLDHGFYSLLALAQALGDVELQACRITVISNETQDVLGNETLRPEKATVTGPCKVIPQEYPALSCSSIDITLPAAGTRQEQALIKQLVREVTAAATEPVVALRGNRRWIQTFEPVQLTEQDTQHYQLRSGGVYLITGGLGGIGLAMAEYLARTLQARLVLTNRSGLPARSEWDAIIEARGDTTGIGRQISKIQAMEAYGAEVLVVKADVANETQMRVAIEQTLATFGTLHGVLHAAGLPGIGLIQLKTPEQAASVLAPKVMGTLVLEHVLREIPLDFLVLFSSVTSTTGGGPGQVDYCAANAFLDAYARKHNGQHGMTVAINWGEWQWNAWEAGLAGYDPETQAFFRAYRQRFGIAFEEGAEALRRILASQMSHVVVSTQNFRAMVDISKSYTAATMLQRTQENRQSRPTHARPTLGSEYVAPKSELERRIATFWEELLGITQVGINDNFFELGGNSLVGIDLIGRLRKELNLETLPAYVLYEAPTVATMAHYLEQGKTNEAVEMRFERGEKRRESLKQRMGEARRTR